MADRSLSTSEPLSKQGKPYLREQHRMTRTRVYRIWSAINRRCSNPNADDYARYGGRGITVCERWVKSFEAFYADMGEPPAGMQIDRIDNGKGYEPGNCRWVTSSANNRNRRDSVYVEFRGERLHIRELAERFGIRPATLAWRLKQGMSPEDAATKPLVDPNGYFEFKGERLSMSEICRRFGLERQTIERRMKRDGMSIEEAATTPLKRVPFIVTYEGRQMRLSELSTLTGIHELTLAYRIRTKGMSVDDAVQTPIARR